MCAIAAIYAYKNTGAPVNGEELRKIRDQMTTRGPDGAGAWYSDDGRIGMAHRRLAIIDLSANAAQPMLNEGTTLALIFNGEIYNYRELRDRLEAKGYQFKSSSDTEVLLHLYADCGEAMVHQLRGMYAFILWDVRENGLFLARDPYGIKPLYYADDGVSFRAASQVKGLLAGGAIDATPDPAGQTGFFLWGHVPEPYTLFRNIRALPAGHSLWVDGRGKKRQVSFCSVTGILASAESEGDTASSEEALGILREALSDSVRHHLIADVPVGVFLSSGLDSTTLAALAAEQGGDLRTVTLGFEEFRGTARDEIALAEQVARQYRAKHSTIRVTRRDFTSHGDAIFHAMDQPTIDGVNTYFVSLAAKRAGLKVALSGLGGDELFGGYPSFREIPRLVNVLRPLRSVARFGSAFRSVSAPVLRHLTSPKYAGLLEYGSTYSGAYLLRRGMFMPWELPEILDPDLVRQGWNELQTLVRLEETTAGLASARSRVSALESSWYMRNQLLRDADWAGMAHSLEIRVPLVDLALLRSVAPRLASNLPPAKRDMAAAPRERLPQSVLDRPKTGFSIPVREWLMEEGQSGAGTRCRARGRGLRGWASHVYHRFVGN